MPARKTQKIRLFEIQTENEDTYTNEKMEEYDLWINREMLNPLIRV